MGKIVWLASYPKSGNTWLRALLTNYRRNDAEPASIEELADGLSAAGRHVFDEWCGVKASALPETAVDRLRPAVYRCLAREAAGTHFMKVHDAWRRTDRGEALFPEDATLGVIYILRNPLDLAVSYAHHGGVGLAETVERLCDSSFALANRPDRLSNQLPQRLGSWSDHPRSWLDESGLPVCLVRYEDLQREPEATFGRVVSFCGLERDAERVLRAVAFSSFSELQLQEQRGGFSERPPQASAPFFRRGQVGSWRASLTADQVARLIEAHGPCMHRFGYLGPDDRPTC